MPSHKTLTIKYLQTKSILLLFHNRTECSISNSFWIGISQTFYLCYLFTNGRFHRQESLRYVRAAKC